jgi:glutathione S-transferase
MKLYDAAWAPNARRVRIFLAEKGVSVPLVPVDLRELEHKSEVFTALNPLQRVPVLTLDDGTVIAESMAICRYFETLRPDPPLFGRDAREMALVVMWIRRVELQLYEAVAAVFRHLHPAMRAMEKQIPEWGEANKPRVLELLELIDRELEDQLFITGNHYTVADITGLVSIDFMKSARLALPEGLPNLRRWHAEVSGRPSAAA